MIHFQVRHLMGVLKCHQLIAVPITTEKKRYSRLFVVTPFQLRPKKKDTVVWPSFVAPFQLPLLRRSNYDRKKKIQMSVHCYAVPNTTKKKIKNLAGVQSILWPEKKVLVVCLAGAWSLLQPEKKVLVVCWAQPVPITTGKKKIQSSVHCYAIPNTTGKQNNNLAGGRSLLWPEKKSSSCLSGRCMIVITTRKKKSSSRLLGPARSNYDRMLGEIHA